MTDPFADPAPDPRALDGNVAGGLLGAVFGLEMTLAEGTCEGCGATNPVGALAAYVTAIGAVLRCPACGRALLSVVDDGKHYRLEMRGVRSIRLEKRGP